MKLYKRDKKLIENILKDYDNLKSLGYNTYEIRRFVLSRDYTREYAFFPRMIFPKTKLPKDVKLKECEFKIYKFDDSKNGKGKKIYFIPYGDDLYIKGIVYAAKITKEGEHIRYDILKIRDWKEYRPVDFVYTFKPFMSCAGLFFEWYKEHGLDLGFKTPVLRDLI